MKKAWEKPKLLQLAFVFSTGDCQDQWNAQFGGQALVGSQIQSEAWAASRTNSTRIHHCGVSFWSLLKWHDRNKPIRKPTLTVPGLPPSQGLTIRANRCPRLHPPHYCAAQCPVVKKELLSKRLIFRSFTIYPSCACCRTCLPACTCSGATQRTFACGAGLDGHIGCLTWCAGPY